MKGRDLIGRLPTPEEAYLAMIERRRLARRLYLREWARAKREERLRQPMASLHALKCAGPTQASGCKCRKIMVAL